MKHKPTLGDVQASKKFSPGDRVLVKTSEDLNSEQRRKLENTIQKFAGVALRILVVNCTTTKVVRVSATKAHTLCGPENFELQPKSPELMNVSCGTIELTTRDQLLVIINRPYSAVQREHAIAGFKRWTGPDIEVRLETTHGGTFR